MLTQDIDTRHGRMRVVVDDVWVSRSLRELGEYSQSELELMKYILAGRDATVVEAGAYIGDLTVPLSRLVKKIYAFEPQEDIREILQWNLKENGCTNVEVLPYALGHENAIVNYRQDDPLSPGSTMMCDTSPDGCTQVAEVRTLDSFNLDVDFIKGDVEGMEVLLLAGAQETIARRRPVLFMERDTVNTPGQISLNEALGILGYDIHPMTFMMWNPNNWKRVTENPFSMTASFMTLGLPRG